MKTALSSVSHVVPAVTVQRIMVVYVHIAAFATPAVLIPAGVKPVTLVVNV